MANPEKENSKAETLSTLETESVSLKCRGELLKQIESKAETLDSSEAAEKIARKKIEQEAVSGIDAEEAENQMGSEAQSENWSNLGKAAKQVSFKESMKKVQSQMTPSGRAFSRFIHSPVVEVASEVTARTVARPSSLLGAGVVGLLGIGAITFLAKHTGFSLSGSELPLLMAGGALVGVCSEMIIRLVRRLSN